MPSKIKVVGAHLEAASEAKLAELARSTQRTRSGVIRLLLERARVLPCPDITVEPIAVDTSAGAHDAD